MGNCCCGCFSSVTASVLEPCAPCFLSPIVCFDASVIWRSGAKKDSKKICLTIDDFPDEKLTLDYLGDLLELLSEYGAKATFFTILSFLREKAA